MNHRIKIYLAGPYTHRDPAVLQWRYERLTEAAALLLCRGIKPIYSPITHSHPISLCPTAAQYAVDHDIWMDFDLPFLAQSEALWIVTLPGWAKSRGVRAEVRCALKCSIPVYLAAPTYDDIYRITDLIVDPVSKETALSICEEPCEKWTPKETINALY